MVTNTARLTEPQITLKTGDIDDFNNNWENRNRQSAQPHFP